MRRAGPSATVSIAQYAPLPPAMEMLSERHEPPSPSAAPRRSSLKGSCGSLQALDSCAEQYRESESALSDACSATPLTDTSTRKPKFERRASWSDDCGQELQTVHHVHDTHYQRTFWRRHRYEFVCCMVSASCVGLVTALLLGVAGLAGAGRQ